MVLIRKELVNGYLRILTAGRAAATPNPMEALEQLDADTRSTHRRAHKEENLTWLQIALADLIRYPHGRIGAFAGSQYPYDDMELVTILKRAHKNLWPDFEQPEVLNRPEERSSISYVDMSADEWESSMKDLARGFLERYFESDSGQ